MTYRVAIRLLWPHRAQPDARLLLLRAIHGERQIRLRKYLRFGNQLRTLVWLAR